MIPSLTAAAFVDQPPTVSYIDAPDGDVVVVDFGEGDLEIRMNAATAAEFAASLSSLVEHLRGAR